MSREELLKDSIGILHRTFPEIVGKVTLHLSTLTAQELQLQDEFEGYEVIQEELRFDTNDSRRIMLRTVYPDGEEYVGTLLINNESWYA